MNLMVMTKTGLVFEKKRWTRRSIDGKQKAPLTVAGLSLYMLWFGALIPHARSTVPQSIDAMTIAHSIPCQVYAETCIPPNKHSLGHMLPRRSPHFHLVVQSNNDSANA